MSSGYFCKHLCSSRSSCHYAFGFAPKMAEPQDASVPINESQNPHASVDGLAPMVESENPEKVATKRARTDEPQSEDVPVVSMVESENPEEVEAKKARTDEDQSEDVLAVVLIDAPEDPDEVAARTVRTDEKVTWEYRNSEDKYWKEMGDYHSNLYERQYITNQYYFTYNHQYGKKGEKNYFYKVDLNNFLQKNFTTGTVRRIRRCVERVERVPDDVPVAMAE